MIDLLNPAIGRGAVFLYLQYLSSIVAGYIFWIFMTKFATTEIIGTFAVIISLSEIFSNFAIIGIPDGIQRFLGKSLSERRIANAKLFVKSSIAFTSIGIVASSTVILFFSDWFVRVFEISFNMIIVIDLLLASSAFYLVLYSVVIASLKTKVLPIIIIISSTTRVVVGIIVAIMDGGVLGLALGYTFLGQTLSSILLGIVIARELKPSEEDNRAEMGMRKASKDLLTASIVAWMPNLITIIGLELGTLIVFGTQGPDQSGIYFIVITLVSGVNTVLYSLFTIALPVLSTMLDGRKRFAWEAIRLSSIITLPLSSSLIFYSKDILQLLGSSYVEGTLSFQILLLSVFPNTVAAGVETLVYSYGYYRRSLAINITMNIPRTALYFILVPSYGMGGAAASYMIGSLTGMCISIIVAKRVSLNLKWKTLLLLLVIPMTINASLASLNISFTIGILTTIVISYFLIIRLNILTRSDIVYLVRLFPYTISEPLMRTLKRIYKVLKKFLL